MRRKLYGNTISPACEVCAYGRRSSGSTEWPLTGMENFSCPAGQNLTKNQAAGT